MARTELRWLRLSLVFVRLWTAFASLWEWNGQSLALLSSLPDNWPWLKPALIAAGAATDALLGLWLWRRPGRPAYGAALIVMVLMTLLATAIDPGWWLHPLGPLSKNIPIAAALLLLWRLDSRA
ncbi:MAG: DoxX-like family protein [Hydrogenophaga sp.]|nr:DoxX-like family protein [Hydrogenophaga sp.]